MARRRKLTKKRALIILLTLLALFLVLNINYFWAQTKFLFFKPKPISQNQDAVITKSNWLSIESLGIQAPVVYATATTETAFQAALINGVVHYPGAANPGEFGNCYIFGHSSDFFWSKGKYKAVFAVLPKIEKGAEIKVSNAKGKEFTYTVVDSKRVAANDLSVLEQEDRSRRLLTLQTSYPIGTALARWVVVAEILK